MYVVREGFNVMRVFRDFDEANRRYEHLVTARKRVSDDVELHRLVDGDGECTECLRSNRGSYKQLLSEIEGRMLDIKDFHDEYASVPQLGEFIG